MTLTFNHRKDSTMTTTFIEMTEDEFDDNYPLVPNYWDLNASWAYGDGPDCLFKTYSEELDFVREQDPNTIWTLVDGSGGDQYLRSGYHLVGRIGHLISTVPVPDGTEVQVRLPMGNDDTPEAGEAEVQP